MGITLRAAPLSTSTLEIGQPSMCTVMERCLIIFSLGFLPPIYNRVDFIPFLTSIRVTASQASIKPKDSVILSEEPIEQNEKNELTVNPQEF